MGTTLAALNAGSVSYAWVVAIEGYKYLLTDAPPAAAVTAYAGTDWTAALPGLTVDVQNRASLNPWEPFTGGGTATFAVLPEATDQFGIDTHRRNAGGETQLAATADRAATTLTVASTSTFAASGEAFIGTECFAYTGVTGTTFTGVTRGRYSPFAAGGTGAPRFAGYHRVLVDANQVQLAPVVSQYPRTWIGKWVAIRMHRVVGGVLDVVAQAHVVFAGRIVEKRDDATTGATVISVAHVLDVLKDTTIGRGLLTGTLAEGVQLQAGMTFGFRDSDQVVFKTANTLAVVASGAAGANQINAGFYTFGQMTSALNAWLAAEFAAARLLGQYTTAAPVTSTDSQYHFKVHWYIATANGPAVSWTLTLPLVVATWFGLTSNTPSTSITTWGAVDVQAGGWRATQYAFQSPGEPTRVVLLYQGVAGLQDAPQQLTITAGAVQDQFATLPGGPPTSGGKAWGLFMIDDKLLIMASYSGGVLANIKPLPLTIVGALFVVPAAYNRPALDSVGPVTVRQVFILSRSFATLLLSMTASSGTVGYNDATYDDLAYGLGLGLPGGLLGAGWVASVQQLPGADAAQLVIVDKPTKFSDLFGGDLILRRASFGWKQGALRLATLVTPTVTGAIAALAETTKAQPIGNADVGALRAASTETTQWQSPLVKIAYNRDITKPGDAGYQSFITFEDGTTVDDQGGAGDPRTINARNSYQQAANTGTGIEALFPSFLASMPLTSRPLSTMRVPIDQRYYEQIAPGDVVTVTDAFARDPSTGQRKVVARPAVVVSHSYTLGGPAPGAPDQVTSQSGEVELFMLQVNRVAAYCPSAQVDATASTGGFTAGYNAAGPTIRCVAHTNSDASEAVDAASFAVGDVIDIVQIDVASGGIVWTARTITGRSANDLTFTPALSAPAFDTTKQYRIRSSHYGAAQLSQRANVYQGGTSGLVESTVQDAQYGQGNQPGTFSVWAAGEAAELVTSDASGDGLARDTGHERALVRLVNALADYKTARSSPMLDTTIRENTSYSAGAGWQLLYCSPMFISTEYAAAGVQRIMRVAPWICSSTGASVSLRVTFTQDKPPDLTINDVNRGNYYVDATWTTSSTTWALGAETSMNVQAAKPASGVVWVLIEATLHGQTIGLGECSENYRQVI